MKILIKSHLFLVKDILLLKILINKLDKGDNFYEDDPDDSSHVTS